MDKTKEQADQLKIPKSGPLKDVEHMKQGAAGSIAELREFVAGLKGRKPQEVLGIVAKSGLTKGILHATLGCALMLVVLTVLPYSLADDTEKKEQEKIVAAEKAKQEAADNAKAESAADAAKTADTSPKTEQQNQAEAAAKMGIDKVADPGTEPPDPLDSLLDRD
jgi:hypothetical protein